ncbi:hypothetical protein Syun_014561 [Stephania yunnanensis]|uniref:Uncharacterized protein n=1 Tax=Stephania yunnanensis TaxID=152371 RepID=A0AAP0JJK7_9MAGN
MDDPVVDPADDPALLEIDDRMDYTVILMMMLLHLHILVGGGARGGDGDGSSRPISTPNEPIKLLRRDFQTMQTNILRVMQYHTLTQDHLRVVQGQLNRMEQPLMDIFGISFAPSLPRDVPPNDSETDDNLDD